METNYIQLPHYSNQNLNHDIKQKSTPILNIGSNTSFNHKSNPTGPLIVTLTLYILVSLETELNLITLNSDLTLILSLYINIFPNRIFHTKLNPSLNTSSIRIPDSKQSCNLTSSLYLKLSLR